MASAAFIHTTKPDVNQLNSNTVIHTGLLSAPGTQLLSTAVATIALPQIIATNHAGAALLSTPTTLPPTLATGIAVGAAAVVLPIGGHGVNLPAGGAAVNIPAPLGGVAAPSTVAAPAIQQNHPNPSLHCRHLCRKGAVIFTQQDLLAKSWPNMCRL